MKINYPYLSDRDFLSIIDKQIEKEHYLKIYSLDWMDEDAVAEIQGLVTSGTVNMNGNSAVRRTCNLTMFVDTTDEKNITDIISYNKKVFIEVGYKNLTNLYEEYPIIWFPLDTYIVTGASYTHNLQGLVLNLQLKDKMCLLNGSISGTLPACVDFAQYDIVNSEGNTEIVKVPIKEIIREALNHFGNEPEERIVISGIPDLVKQPVQQSSDLLTDSQTGFTFTYLNTTDTVKINDDRTVIPCPFVDAGVVFDYTNPEINVENAFGYAWIEDKEHTNLGPQNVAEVLKKYSMIKSFEPSEYIGYEYTDFVYPGELTTNYGNSICDVLDKIKNAFSNYEQFYKNDTFYFQEKNNQLNQRDIFNTPEHSAAVGDNNQLSNTGQDISTLSSYYLNVNPKSEYSFDNNNIVVSFSNTPKYENIKNDFTVWGIRKNGSSKTALRYHLAIDNKPKAGSLFLIAKGRSTEDGTLINDYNTAFATAIKFIITSEDIHNQSGFSIEGNVNVTYALVKNTTTTPDEELTVDQRRNIITAALNKLNGDISILVGGSINSAEGLDVNEHEADTNTPMILYYYDPSAAIEESRFIKFPAGTGRIKIITTNDWRDEIYLQGLWDEIAGVSTNYYFTEIKAEWSKVYNSWTNAYLQTFANNPGSCNWYLDIINSEELDAFSVPKIGRRAKVVQDQSVNCVFESIIPDFAYINCGKQDTLDRSGEGWDGLKELHPMLNLNGNVKKEYAPTSTTPDTSLSHLTTLTCGGITKDDVDNYYKKKTCLVTNVNNPYGFFDSQSNMAHDKEDPSASISYFKGTLEDGLKIIAKRNQANADNMIPIGITYDMAQNIHIAANQNSALYAVRDMLTEYTSLQNTITIECLPIYYLEPNTRITVNDNKSNIHGDFLIDTISCPLSANGNMTITASKIVDKI